jgi:DNA-binding CsgD family transcriptional regulator
VLRGGCKFSLAAAHARLGLESARRARDPGLLARAPAADAMHAFFAAGGIKFEQLARGITLEDESDAITYKLPTTVNGNVLWWSDDLNGARQALGRAMQRAVEHGEDSDVALFWFHLAVLEWKAGDHQTAERCRANAEVAIREYGDAQDRAWLLCAESMFAAGRGELVNARALAVESLAAGESVGDLMPAACASAVLAAVELWNGEPVAAHDRLQPLGESFLANGFAAVGALTLSLWSCDVEALIATDRFAEANAVLSELFKLTLTSENPHANAVALRCDGLLVAARGEISSAIETMDQALAEHARRTLPLELGRTLLEKGSLERRAKRKSAAKQTLEEALVILEPLEASMWVARARDELSRIGLRPAAATEGLTQAQTRVAELVLACMSNREIASTLCMSSRSVESHLTKIYREFGVRSRTQLVTAMSAGPSDQTPS